MANYHLSFLKNQIIIILYLLGYYIMSAKSDYIGLYNKDAILTLSGGDIIGWKWRIPQSLNRRKSPVWYISLKNLYLDDSTGTTAGRPHFLRCKVVSENYHTYEDPTNTLSTNMINYPILALLSRDTPTGHWTTWTDNPFIQISSNIQYLEFDIIDGNGNVLIVASTAGETLNMILEVKYPEHNEIQNETIMSYAQSTVGNPPFNRL